jgi:putative ABC transport system permease protein
MEKMKHIYRARRGLPIVENSFRDLRHGLRMLHRTPAFTGLAVLTLAIGIGANTALFSIIRAVFLQPLPYPDSGRVVMLWQSDPRKGIREQLVTPANFVDWRQHNQVFEDIAFTAGWQRLFNIVSSDGNRQVSGAVVSGALFPILRVQPVSLPKTPAGHSNLVRPIGAN